MILQGHESGQLNREASVMTPDHDNSPARSRSVKLVQPPPPNSAAFSEKPSTPPPRIFTPLSPPSTRPLKIAPKTPPRNPARLNSIQKISYTPTGALSRATPTRIIPGRPDSFALVSPQLHVIPANRRFNFHPVLHPPPAVATNSRSTPTRTLAGLRYTACMDDEEGTALPAWIHFESRDLSVWGIPTSDYVGSEWAIKVIVKGQAGHEEGVTVSRVVLSIIP